MTTETETPTFEGNPPPDEVLEEVRDLLAEALRGHANIAVNTSIHLEDVGDEEAAEGEMTIAMLSVWLADNVSAWTHTTRLREGVSKFDPKAAGVALAQLVMDDETPNVEIVARNPVQTIPDDCDGDSEVCHACHTHHPGGVGGAWCPAAGYVRPVAPVVSPDELDENDPEWRP